MKKTRLFILFFMLSIGFLSAFAYDFSLEKPVVFENYYITYKGIGTESKFDLTSTSTTYTQLVPQSNSVQIMLRGMVNFGEIDGADGAITLTYSNTGVPTDSVSTNQALGTATTFDIYIDNAKTPLVQVPVYKTRIKVNGVLTTTQLSTQALISAMPSGRHRISIFYNGHKSTLFNVKIESNGSALAQLNTETTDVTTASYNTGATPTTVSLPFRVEPFYSDGNILINAVEFPLSPSKKITSGNNMLYSPSTNSRGCGRAVDIGWVKADNSWICAGKCDFGSNNEYVSVALKAYIGTNPNFIYEIWADTTKVGSTINLKTRLAVINFANGYRTDIDGDSWAETFFKADSIPTGVHMIFIKSITATGDIRSIAFNKAEPVDYSVLNSVIAKAVATPTSVPAADGVTCGYTYPADKVTAFTNALTAAQTMSNDSTATSQADVSNAISTLNTAISAMINARIFTANGSDFIIYPADFISRSAGAGTYSSTNKYISGTTAGTEAWFVGTVDFGTSGSYLSSAAMTARQYSEGNFEFGGVISGSAYKLYADSLSGALISTIPMQNTSNANGTTFVQSSDTMKVMTGVHKLYIKWIGSASNLQLIDLSTTDLGRFYPLQVALDNAKAINLAGKAIVPGSSGGYSYPESEITKLSTKLSEYQAVYDAQTASNSIVATTTKSVYSAVDTLRLSRIIKVTTDSTFIYPADFMGKVSGTGSYEGGNNLGSAAANLIWYIGKVDFGTTNKFKSLSVSTSRKWGTGDTDGFAYDGDISSYGAYYQISLDSVAGSIMAKLPMYNTSTVNWANYVTSTMPIDSTLTGEHKLYVKFIGTRSNMGKLSIAAKTITGVESVVANKNFKIYAAANTIYLKGNVEGSKLEIFTATGMKVADKRITQEQTGTTLPQGVYVVRVSSAKEGITTAKVILQ